jgi:hypothetical protein
MSGMDAAPTETRRLILLIERTLAEADLTTKARSDLIAEMSGDVEDLYALYRRRGDDHATAVANIERRLLASPETLSELVALYRPLHVRLVDRLSDPARRRWDSWLPVAAMVPLLGLAALQLMRPAPLGSLAPFGWLVLVMGVAAAVTAVLAIQPSDGGRRDVVRLRSARIVVAGLGFAAPAFALFGGAAGLYRIAGVLSDGNVDPQRVLTPWIANAGLLVTAGIACAVCVGFLWFVLTTRLLRAESMHTRPFHLHSGGRS